MPEIIITHIDPTIRTGRSDRIINATTLAKLPDKSGSYQLDDGTPIKLDLSQIRYIPSRVVEVTIQDWISDAYGHGTLGPITIQRRIPTKSWNMVVESEILGGKITGTEADKFRSEVLSGIRTIPINRKGVGTQMLPEARELVIKLNHPIINYHRETEGKWVQTHYYPDYPEMGGVVDCQNGRPIAVETRDKKDKGEDEYSWVDTLSEREMDALRLVLPKIGGELRVRLQRRRFELLEIAHNRWLLNHPHGNYI